jgi:hypothetical protein
VNAVTIISESRRVLAGVVRVREALEDGDDFYAWELAEQLEFDLVGLVYQLEGRRTAA